MNETKRSILSQEEKLILEIFTYNKKGKPIYPSKLEEIYKDQISKSNINKIIDKLFNLNVINAKWENDRGKWVRSLYVTEENKSKRDFLSNEEKIALEIYRYNNIIKQPIYFSKLVELLEGKVSRNAISKKIDKLFDLCMIDAKWENDEGKWVRSLYIDGGEYKEYFKHLYNNYSDRLVSRQ
ncbi:hypothetical protein FXV91_11780 [Methanosarcina sp. DH2]|jgi:DNA-binding transcriptional ArsR family regulator|uniref:hypothetical protein n=1 Tax=Methanosarcina sp. DH2 TaxID=2605639 RepID=UPI001E436163|nr:hypothetical protein [Methanosarcina sp. DH2]MCC4770833.1 hypothetical protein [Methanosarcina sp. DH2]